MPNTTSKFKIIFLAFFSIAFFAIANNAQADIFVDNAATGCANGSTLYNPSTRTCSGGTHTVYTTLPNANSGISAGTSANRTVVNIRSGTPYLTTLTITKNYTTWRKYPADSAKPVIDGEFNRPVQWQGLFYINGQTGITVDSIKFTNTGYKNSSGVQKYSGAEGIRLNQSSFCVVQNCDFVNIGDGAIMVVDGSSYNIIQNNYTENTNLCTVEGTWEGVINIYGYQPVATRGSHHNLVKNNVVYNSRGEAIQSFAGTHHNIIDSNTIIDCKRVFLYVNNGYNEVVRNNLLYHTWADSMFAPTGSYGAIGIMFSGDTPNNIHGYDNAPYNRKHRVYANKTVGINHGLYFTINELYGPDVQIHDTRVFNNTFIEARRYGATPVQIGVHNVSPSDIIGTGIYVKNNIFWQTTGTLAEVTNDINFSTNIWNKAPETDARDSTDPGYSAYTALTMSNYLAKSTGWDTIVPKSLTGAEFNLVSSATQAIDKAEWLTTITSASGSGTSFAVADAEYFTDGFGIPTAVGDVIQTQGSSAPVTITSINYETKTITVSSPISWQMGDGVAMTYSGAKPDIGAKEYGGSSNPTDTTASAVPSGLAVR